MHNFPDLSGFNANDYEPDFGFSAIPAGAYRAIITDTRWKQTKAGNGQYLELKFQVIDGPYKDRFLWTRLNLDHPSSEAMHFAKAELSAICRAVGVEKPGGPAQLLNIPLELTVKCRHNDYIGEQENVIRAYTSLKTA